MATKLISANPELLQYAHKSMHVTVLGGIKLTGQKGEVKITRIDWYKW